MLGLFFIYSTNLCLGPHGLAVSKTDENLSAFMELTFYCEEASKIKT